MVVQSLNEMWRRGSTNTRDLIYMHTCVHTHACPLTHTQTQTPTHCIMLLWQDRLRNDSAGHKIQLSPSMFHKHQPQSLLRELYIWLCRQGEKWSMQTGITMETGGSQANVETQRRSISPIWLIPFSLSTLLILWRQQQMAQSQLYVKPVCTLLTLSLSLLACAPRLLGRATVHVMISHDRLDIFHLIVCKCTRFY